MITVAALIACGVGPTQARVFAEPLTAACDRFSINTRHRIAGFLGQYLIETSNLTALEEVLYYRSADRIAAVFKRLRDRLSLNDLAKLARNPQGLGNAAYAGVNGNGDVSSGDGFRYRGRGLAHLTGRGNYAAAAEALGRPYLESPELVALPPDACLTGAWYWDSNRCNALADTAQWDALTRVVNGPAMMRSDDRHSLSNELLQALP